MTGLILCTVATYFLNARRKYTGRYGPRISCRLLDGRQLDARLGIHREARTRWC